MSKSRQFEPGHKFPGTRFTFVENSPIIIDKKRTIVVDCECGTRKVIALFRATTAKSKSCGCYNREQTSKLKRKHHFEAGYKFPDSRLTYKQEDKDTKTGERSIIAECECGVTKSYNLTPIIAHKTKSCGCYSRDALRERKKTHFFNPNHKFENTRWTLINEIPNGINEKRRVLVACDCGTVKNIDLTSILSGQSKSCGCFKTEQAKIENVKHRFEPGYKFPNTRLTFLEELWESPFERRRVLVQCDCGRAPHATSLLPILHGGTKSCGCYLAEITRKRFTTHGLTANKKLKYLYKLHYHITHRVTKDPVYVRRGIKLYEPWQGEEGRLTFINYVLENLGHRPDNCDSLDRINNNGNYEPGNIRWADMKTQNNNTSRNVVITYKGKTQSVTQWSEELGINAKLTLWRIKTGWTPEEAFFTPAGVRRNNYVALPPPMEGI